MLLRDLQRLFDTFADGNRRNDHNELAQPVLLKQALGGAQIYVGFAGSRLHFYGEVRKADGGLSGERVNFSGNRLQGVIHRQSLAGLHFVQVRQDLVLRKVESVGYHLESRAVRYRQLAPNEALPLE